MFQVSVLVNELLVDVIGWIGAGLILFAYFQISKGKFSGDSTYYQLLNVFGSAFLIINTLYYGAIPSAAVNIIWIAIALYVLLKN